jgi:hypothetical protein
LNTEGAVWQLEKREGFEDHLQKNPALRNAFAGWWGWKDKRRFPQLEAAKHKPHGSCFLQIKKRDGPGEDLKEPILYFVTGTSCRFPSEEAFFINLKVPRARFGNQCDFKTYGYYNN